MLIIIIGQMINIPMDEFILWFQTKMNSKYAMKIESLKRSIIYFYNLTGQVISLYHTMRQKMEKYSDKEEYKDILALLNRSLIIVAKIIQKIPVCLDSLFCDKFIKTFDFSINLLCTYYHSLNHYQIINKQAKTEKDKIVEGINKMYTIHVKIKDIYKHNIEVLQTLTLISDYKNIFTTKISSIQSKKQLRKISREHYADNFQTQALEFYEGLLQKMRSVNEQPQAKKSLMKVYFQLMHQLYSTQAQLQLLLDNAIRICGQIRGRKKNISFIGQEHCNQLSRWVSVLLKPNVSLKSIKKLKMQDFIKAMSAVLQEKETMNYEYVEHFDNNQEEIQALINLIIDIAKELEKIEQAGLLTLVSEYKDNLMPAGSKKFISRLLDYQMEMSRFYSLHEEMKQLQRLVQSIVLEELGQKVNIMMDQYEQSEKRVEGEP